MPLRTPDSINSDDYQLLRNKHKSNFHNYKKIIFRDGETDVIYRKRTVDDRGRAWSLGDNKYGQLGRDAINVGSDDGIKREIPQLCEGLEEGVQWNKVVYGWSHTILRGVRQDGIFAFKADYGVWVGMSIVIWVLQISYIKCIGLLCWILT